MNSHPFFHIKESRLFSVLIRGRKHLKKHLFFHVIESKLFSVLIAGKKHLKKHLFFHVIESKLFSVLITGKKHLKKQKQHGVTYNDLFCPVCQCAVTDRVAMRSHLQGNLQCYITRHKEIIFTVLVDDLYRI